MSDPWYMNPYMYDFYQVPVYKLKWIGGWSISVHFCKEEDRLVFFWSERLVSQYCYLILFFFQIHAQFKYNHDTCQYNLTDFGSQNGTFLNEQRISEVWMEGLSGCCSLFHNLVASFTEGAFYQNVVEWTTIICFNIPLLPWSMSKSKLLIKRSLFLGHLKRIGW